MHYETVKVERNKEKSDQVKELKIPVLTKSQEDQQNLETIAKIESIIGKEALSEITGFYNYASAALANNQFSNRAIKVLNIVGGLISNLEEWLDFSSLYESVGIEQQITIILTQIENWFDFVASGTIYIGLPPRYPGFDPDYDNNGGFSGGKEGDSYNPNFNNHESVNLFMLLFIGQTSTNTTTTLDNWI